MTQLIFLLFQSDRRDEARGLHIAIVPFNCSAFVNVAKRHIERVKGAFDEFIKK